MLVMDAAALVGSMPAARPKPKRTGASEVAGAANRAGRRRQ